MGMGLLSKPVHASAPIEPLDEATVAAFGCDVCFISDDGAPADAMIAGYLAHVTDSSTARLITENYGRLRAEYEAGLFLTHPARVLALMKETASCIGVEPSEQML